MFETINNALNFYISGTSETSNASIDLVMTSQVNEGVASGLDLFIYSEPYEVDNSLNLFIQSNSIGDTDNYLNLCITNSSTISTSLDFGMFYQASGGTYGTIGEEWGDLDEFWGSVSGGVGDPLDGILNFTLKGNWFYSLNNSLNLYIKRNENESLFFVLKVAEGEPTESLPFYMIVNETLDNSTEMYVDGIGVNIDELNLYTHGF